MKKKKAILKFTLTGKNAIWGKTKGLKCEIYSLDFIEEYGNKTLKVSHNLGWDIYTDESFEKAITKYAKIKFPKMKIHEIIFSEQGLQNNYLADMDVLYKPYGK